MVGLCGVKVENCCVFFPQTCNIQKVAEHKKITRIYVKEVIYQVKLNPKKLLEGKKPKSS